MRSITRLAVAAAAAALLLACNAAAQSELPKPANTTSLGFGLFDVACPPVSAELLSNFTTGPASVNSTFVMTKAQSAAVACQLKWVLARAAAGNTTATAILGAMFTAWRDAYKPQTWQVTPTSQQQWLVSLQTVVTINTNLSSRFWAGLNAYSDLSPEQFAQTVLMSKVNASISPVVTTKNTTATTTVTPITSTATSTANITTNTTATANKTAAASSASTTNPAKATTAATTATVTSTTATGKKLNRKLQANCLDCGRPTTPTYPATINWVAAGKVLPTIGFQAQCGSSWAFAAATAMESKLLIDSSTGAANASAASNASAAAAIDPLSAQHLLDCTARTYNYTGSVCLGGAATDAFKFAAAAGVTADSAYRYRPNNPGADIDASGFPKQCDRTFLTGQPAKAGLVQITSQPAFTQIPARSKLALIQALAAQPALTYLTVDSTFQHYAGGIWSSSSCSGATPTHALLIVGYSTERAGFEYWMAKNSFGPAWGELGFAKIAMSGDGDGMCGMYQTAFQPGTVTPVAAAKPGNGNNKV